MTVQTGAGINKIVENDMRSVSEEEIVTWFQKQIESDQMAMITNAKQILKKTEAHGCQDTH